jgi:hypothetical protein
MIYCRQNGENSLPRSQIGATSLLVTPLFALQPIHEALPVDILHCHHFLSGATPVDLLQCQLTSCGTKQIADVITYHQTSRMGTSMRLTLKPSAVS